MNSHKIFLTQVSQTGGLDDALVSNFRSIIYGWNWFDEMQITTQN